MKAKLFLLALAVFVLSLALVSAAPGGATTAVGTSETGTGTAATTVDAEGGNVTYVDVSSTVITSRWAGFFGNVSGNLLLGDASANTFYQWSVSDLSGAVVYAANNSITDWSDGNIVPLANANAPTWVAGANTDNFTSTFNASEAFVSSSLNKAGTPFATTFNSSGVAGDLKTYALYSTADTANIWAGLVVDDTNGFNNATVDYQILLPAQTGTTYSFYLELP
jgi:hypothetical protein